MLNFQYPVWYLSLCILFGVLLAVLLYYKDMRFKELANPLKYVMATLRALAGALLAALLLAPMLKTTKTEIKKPLIVIAQDASESMSVAIRDSSTFKKDLETLSKNLGEQFDVKQYAFGESVREGFDVSFKDKLTNIADLLNNVYDNYTGQNLGGVVLATDGIYNEGASPIYSGAKLNVPIYTIALGDTTPKKDVLVKRVFHNNIAYLGDKFSVQIDVGANNCMGATTNLTIAQIDAGGNSKQVAAQSIAINKNDFFFTKEITLDATTPGVQHYVVSLSSVPGETTTANNTKDFFVEILDARTKILILANAPHPDISALNDAISVNKNYTVSVSYISELKSNVADADFVILHQLPSWTNSADAVFNILNTKRIPRLFVVGNQTDTRKLSRLQNLVSINSDGKNTTDAQAVLNSGFNLFTLDDNFRQIPNFNPIISPFGESKEGGGGQVLYYQKIGKIDTKYPLITLGESSGIKTGVFAAEGFWKWRLYDFAQHQNQHIADEMMGKIVQYLSVKEDKRKFRCTTDKTSYRENEAPAFEAELYNNSYELLNEPDVSLQITNAKGQQYNYTMNKTGRSYSYNTGILPVGNYKYKATTNYSGTKYEAEGAFNVQPIQLELFQTTADHATLRALSHQFGGITVFQNQMAMLADSIKAHKLKPMMFTTKSTQPLLNFKWIFTLILGLLTGEWFMRRYFGGY